MMKVISIDWKQQAVQILKNYNSNKESIRNLEERIKILNVRLEGISSGKLEDAGVSRERNELYCDVITQIDNFNARLDCIKRDVALTERGLSALSKAERTAITIKYINCEYNSIAKICEQVHVERTKAYAVCESALRHFAYVLFGGTI